MNLRNFIYKKIGFFSLILLILYCFCSSNNKTIKPNPDNEIYELCTSCKGYGVIESISIAPPHKGVEMNENEKKITTALGEATERGWCLFTIFKSIKRDQNIGSVLPEHDIEVKKKMQESATIDPYEKEKRPYMKEIVECPRCHGIGWIKKSDDLKSKKDQKEYYDAIRSTNELIKK